MSIEKAIAAAGNQETLAAALGVKQPAIAHWKKRGWMPVARALQVEMIYGIDRLSLIKPALQEVLSDKR